jgi:CPA1 family monovalent cation:H+ antiporter
MNAVEIILVLLATCVALTIAADRIRLPYPIVLVIGGAALALIPGAPHLEIEPEIVLVIFLPPLLFSAAWLTSWRDFRAHLRDIGMLAIGLVVATTVGVAAVAHAVVPDLPWSVAFVLGAIVSPPDAVAATTVMRRLRVPMRLVRILEGESLVNDATGLVAYQIALAVVAGSGFSVAGAASRFAVVGLGGIAFGLAVGWAVARVHRHLENFEIETAIDLLTPYVAYIPAEHLGVSGVLAAVTAGGYLGWRSPRLFSPGARLRGGGVWSAVLFLLNSLVFILIGLELAAAHRLFASMPAAGLVEWCAAVAGTAIVIRLVWVPIAMHLPYTISPRIRRRARPPVWKDTIVIAWTAMRGIVSLALVLAVPQVLPDGTPFPSRELLVLIVFVVIAVTLLGQGFTLPLVIRALRFPDDDAELRYEREALARGIECALARLEELAGDPEVPPGVAEVLRARYEGRRERLASSTQDDARSQQTQDEREGSRRLRDELIAAERETFVKLRNRGAISEEIFQRLQRDLDLESLQPFR